MDGRRKTEARRALTQKTRVRSHKQGKSILAGGWNRCAGLSTAEIGRAAEEVAVGFLVKHRVRVLARNLSVGRGEIDILASIAGTRLVVEVRSVRQGTERIDPAMAFDEAKARQVASLAGQIGVGRVDLVTVSFSAAGVEVHWMPSVA